ncbi:GNAT family N-acetyltransferase, partial [Jeotgalibaca porci]
MTAKGIFSNLPTLETERLILRKIAIDDAEDLFAYTSDEAVAKYVTWNAHQTIQDTKDFIQFVLSRYASNSPAPWAIVYKETDKVIGTIDFVSWQEHHKVAEVGYALSKAYWSKGIMSEALEAVMKFGFEHLDLVRIQAFCMVENKGSARVMEKAGMLYEGTRR